MILSKFNPRSRKEFLAEYYVHLLLEKNKVSAFASPDFLFKEKKSLRKALFFKGIFVERISNKILKRSLIPYKGAGPAFILGSATKTLIEFSSILKQFNIEPTLYFYQNTFLPYIPEVETFPNIIKPYNKEIFFLLVFFNKLSL